MSSEVDLSSISITATGTGKKGKRSQRRLYAMCSKRKKAKVSKLVSLQSTPSTESVDELALSGNIDVPSIVDLPSNVCSPISVDVLNSVDSPSSTALSLNVDPPSNATLSSTVDALNSVNGHLNAFPVDHPLISSPCICCGEKSCIVLTCKHRVCQRCELMKHWGADSKDCESCINISLRTANARLDQQLKTYTHIPHARQPTSKASTKSIRDRCTKLHEVITQLAGSDGPADDMTEVIFLFIEYLSRNTAITVGLRKSKLPALERRLTPKEDLALWAKVNITGRQRQILIAALHKLGINPFAPTYAFELERKNAQMQTGLIFSQIALTDGAKRPFMHVKSVRAILTQKVRELKQRGQLHDAPEFGGKLWVAIGGDKGGSTTKLVASIVNAKHPNSVNNLIFLGMYKGADNPKNIRTAFAQISAELDVTTSLSVPSDNAPASNTVEIPIVYFMVADTMFISHAEGHMGVRSMFPCPFCLMPKAVLQNMGNWDFYQKYTDRTIESYHTALQVEVSGSSTEQSQQTTSVSMLPAFNIPIPYISPPQLHIMLGIGNMLYKLLEQRCYASDRGTTSMIPNKEAKKEQAKIKKQLKKVALEIHDAKQNATQTETLLHSLTTAQTAPPKVGRQCDGLICLRNSSRKISPRCNEWVVCLSCSRRLHFACEGVVMVHEIAKSSTGDYKCIQCKGTDDISTLLDTCNLKVNTVKATLDRLLAQQSTLTNDATAYEDTVRNNQGPCVQNLAAALHTLGIDVRAHRTGTFVGNHVRRMVTGRGPRTLAASLGDASETLSDRNMFEKLFTNLGQIQDHFKAEFLLDGAIDLLESLCYQLATDLKAFVPNTTVIPKLHFLTTHIPQFARMHKTLGLLSEQALESFHARINGLERQYAVIRSVERRWRLIIQHHYVNSSI